jgi:adenylyltransferase/sulfurtransferase
MVAQMSVQELARRLRQGDPVQLLDVRQLWEHEIAALPGSTLIPLGELAGRSDEITPTPGVPLVVYCHHGIRSLNGAHILLQQGFVDVFSLAGGIDAWSLQVDASIPRY